MEDLDNEKATDAHSDDELFMQYVACGDAELFYLDAYLSEMLGAEMYRTGVNV